MDHVIMGNIPKQNKKDLILVSNMLHFLLPVIAFSFCSINRCIWYLISIASHRDCNLAWWWSGKRRQAVKKYQG